MRKACHYENVNYKIKIGIKSKYVLIFFKSMAYLFHQSALKIRSVLTVYLSQLKQQSLGNIGRQQSCCVTVFCTQTGSN